MKIAFIVEGDTEAKVFTPILKSFLQRKMNGLMPHIVAISQDGRIPKADKLKRLVESLISISQYDAVLALTDVYTGTSDFRNATDAKRKMRDWVGENPNFYPHAAQHDFEAWLLPYWETIKKKAGHNRNAPGGNPEDVNHNKSPAYHLQQIFLDGNKRDRYNKPREARAILEENDLHIAVDKCPELKSLVNTILILHDYPPIP